MTNYEILVEYWKTLKQKPHEELVCALEKFNVLFVYNTNKLENDRTVFRTSKELVMNGRVSNYTGNPRVLIGQQNQKSCGEYVIPKILERKPITLSLIKEVHLLLTQGIYYDHKDLMESGERSGTFKQNDYSVGFGHIGEAPEDVENHLIEMLDEVNSETGNPLRVGAYLHAKLEHINPFADGNGRVARTLMNYYLLQKEHPPIVVFDVDKQHYYNALETHKRNENIDPLCQFLEHQLTRTWEREIITFAKEQSIPLPE